MADDRPRIADAIIDWVAGRLAEGVDVVGDSADLRAYVLDRVTHAEVEKLLESHLDVSAKAVDRAQLQTCADVLRVVGKFS